MSLTACSVSLLGYSIDKFSIFIERLGVPHKKNDSFCSLFNPKRQSALAILDQKHGVIFNSSFSHIPQFIASANLWAVFRFLPESDHLSLCSLHLLVLTTKRSHLDYDCIPSYFSFPKFILNTSTRMMFLRTGTDCVTPLLEILDSDLIYTVLAKPASLLSLEHSRHSHASGSMHMCFPLYSFSDINVIDSLMFFRNVTFLVSPSLISQFKLIPSPSPSSLFLQ